MTNHPALTGQNDGPTLEPIKISYSIPEAVEATGVGRSYLYLAIKNNELASVKLGKRRLIMAVDLLVWLKRHRVAA